MITKDEVEEEMTEQRQCHPIEENERNSIALSTNQRELHTLFDVLICEDHVS
jgi:hypothetical protein